MSIEKKIAHLIEKDFPAYYREEGPIFVEFLRTYYEWMESQNQTNYHARNILDYKDIDATIDDFIVFFKQKYLPNVQFDTATDVQQLIKHTLDLYRSKGTDRAIDLFFRLVYGKPAEVYYPGDDIFRLSDGKWVKPVYLEITSSEENRKFINKQIVGLTSGATAFVERVIRRKIASKYAEIMFISNVDGNFQTGEKITIDGEFQELNPTIIGSLTTLQIISGGQDFAVGDIVTLTSPNGVQGKARVADVTEYTGLVDFILVDGGWGYSVNAEILVSEKVLTISEISAPNNAIRPFTDFDAIYEPMANISYNAANGTFAANDVLYSYYSNNTVAGTAKILAVTASSSTNGTMNVAITSGKFGVYPELNINSSANVVVSKFSNTIAGVRYNTNLTGTANAVLGNRKIFGTGTLFDKELFTLQSNATGTVSVNSTANTVIGTGTLFDMELTQPAANLTGTVYVNSTSLSVLGIGTNFSSVAANSYIAVYSNATAWQTRQVNSVSNSTALTVKSLFTFNNAVTKYAMANIEPYIAVYTNTTIWQARNIQSITNATLLTVESVFTAANSSTKLSTTWMDDYVTFSNSAVRQVLGVNNVINSTAIWLKWPTEFANNTATVGNVVTTNTKFYVPFANATGAVTFTAKSKIVTGVGTSFNTFGSGDFVALYSNSTTYEIKTVDKVVNSTYMVLTNNAVRTATANAANVTTNSAIFYGRTLVLYANATSPVSFLVQSMANDSHLTLQSRPTFSNGATIFANTKILTAFSKTGNSVVANAVVYTDTTATGNIIGTKANVNLVAVNNSIRFSNDMIVYQTNSTGGEIANAQIIVATYSGTNTFLTVNGVEGSFVSNSVLRSRYANGIVTTSNGTLSNIQYSVGVVGITNVFVPTVGSFVYTSANTRGVITKVSQHNVMAGFDLSSNSLGYAETVGFWEDFILPYKDVYLNSENFLPPGSNLQTKMATANLGTTIIDAFTNTDITIGMINNLVAINPGTDYDTSPVVVVYEPQVAMANRKDFILNISNSVGSFVAGEVLTQNSATVGLIKDANSTVMNVKRITYENPFVANATIAGLSSGATATTRVITEDVNEIQIGLNAVIEANVIAASGSVTTLEIVDSGVGYVDNEVVDFISEDGERAGIAVVNLQKQGQAEGFYASKGSFLSADKKLFDGNYYQEYSYEVRSPITLDKYENMLRNVLHIAGTKFFASVVTPSASQIEINSVALATGISGRVTANTVNGNSAVKVSNTAMLRVGDLVTGTGLQTNASILSINSTAFVMNKTANSTQNGTVVTYTR